MSILFTSIAIGVVAVIVAITLLRRDNNSTPALQAGNTLPAIELTNDQGEKISVETLRGAPAVVIILRGSWCPFCNSQVKDLTSYYRQINNCGAKLIFITPKPLDTTRRVAEIFKVEFDFWIDESLALADALGIRAINQVPADMQHMFGEDTAKPTSIILDAEGIIRYATVSTNIRSRPDPKLLLTELKKITENSC